MSYQVIARKYRPQRFSDVVGQEHVTQTLANAIQQNRIAHAYLFVGPRGTGKTTLARIFAMCLNCTGGPKVAFAADDPRCREIAEGRSLDVLEIDGASNNGVEQVRELRETCKFAPASSKFKIYIIDEVHMLSTAAFNALLKTLEEPPAHVKFIFATTDPEKVLPTILSRCQRFDLRRIPSALIVKHLGFIAEQEKVQIDSPALHAIARGAEGGMRDAESTLDQLISFCGERIVEADVLSMFGLAAGGQILSLARAILMGEIETGLRELNSLAKNGKDLGRLLSDLLNHFRNLLLFQVSNGDLALLEISEAEGEALAGQSPLATQDALTRVMEVLSEFEGRLRDATSKKILLEVAMMKAAQARTAVSIDSVLKKLQALRGEAGGGGSPAAAAPARTAPVAASPAPAPVKRAAVAPTAPVEVPPATVMARSEAILQETPPAPPEAPEVPPPVAPPSAAASPQNVHIEDMWAQVLEAAGRASPFTRSYLIEAHPVSFSKNTLTIGFDPEFADHIGLVDNPKTRTLLQTKLKELGFGDSHVKFIRAEAPPGRVRPVRDERSDAAPATEAAASAPAARPASAPAVGKEKSAPVLLNKEDFKNDPLIRQALEIFKGTIVEVRG
jgi:DNA polymerase-3 subunit gamma/tau